MATTADSLATHRRATAQPIGEVARFLQEVLGQRLTAVIAGVQDAKAVGKWARAGRTPYPAAERRLRDAYQVVELLLRVESPATIRAWFMGMNPLLDDEAPALALAEDAAAVLGAARAFVANG